LMQNLEVNYYALGKAFFYWKKWLNFLLLPLHLSLHYLQIQNRQQKHYQVRKKIVDNNTISVDAERKSGIINEQHLEKLFPLKSVIYQ
jgi:hypothetical protein